VLVCRFAKHGASECREKISHEVQGFLKDNVTVRISPAVARIRGCLSMAREDFERAFEVRAVKLGFDKTPRSSEEGGALDRSTIWLARRTKE
jgi:hypothetical protein